MPDTTIGSHGHWHRRVYDLGEPAFADDLEQSLRALSAAGAPPVAAYRAPEWSINQRSLWALPVLAAHGIRLDASMAPLRVVGSPAFPRQPYLHRTSGGPILEAPPLVADRFGQAIPMGWGWGLRMSTPRRVLEEIERTNQAGAPAVLTIHPWEIDPNPPRVRLPAGLRFAHYFRLARVCRSAAIDSGAAPHSARSTRRSRTWSRADPRRPRADPGVRSSHRARWRRR